MGCSEDDLDLWLKSLDDDLSTGSDDEEMGAYGRWLSRQHPTEDTTDWTDAQWAAYEEKWDRIRAWYLAPPNLGPGITDLWG